MAELPAQKRLVCVGGGRGAVVSYGLVAVVMI